MDERHSTSSRRVVVETIEDGGVSRAVSQVESDQPIETYTPWQPGHAHENLARKLHPARMPSQEPFHTVSLPAFLEEPSIQQPTKHEGQENELLSFTSFATVIRDGISNMQSIAMSVPAFLTVALVLTVTAFFAGRISAGGGKQAEAQAPTPTIQPVGFAQSSTPAAPVQGTPDDIIKASREQFSKVVEASKQPNQTEAQKTDLSNAILRILDSLTKGIAAYPDVASLYFERAQVSKMVMQSAPALKSQADADYKKAIEISPLSADYYIGYADYFDVLGDSSHAMENYQKVLSLDPKNINALYPLAKMYVAGGRKDEALALYKQIVSLLAPNSPQYTQVQQEMASLIPPPPAPVASQSAIPATTSAPTASGSAHP